MMSDTQCTPARCGLHVPSGHLIMHPRWKVSPLVSYLQAKVQVSYMGQIGVVDFHPSSHCSMIYITENDIISCHDFKRRIAKLHNAVGFTNKCVIVDKTILTESHFLKIQEFVVLECNMSIFPTESIEQTAHIIAQMVLQEMKTPERNPFYFKTRQFICTDSDILSVVEKFPRIGSSKAKLLLQHFLSIEGITAASLNELTEVIGGAGANYLHEFLTKS